MRQRKLEQAIAAAHATGSVLVGICGGYQMLGEMLVDPLGIEGAPGTCAAGLNVLPVTTTFQPHKETNQSVFQLHAGAAEWGQLRGYEIHSGVTTLGGEQWRWERLSNAMGGPLKWRMVPNVA